MVSWDSPDADPVKDMQDVIDGTTEEEPVRKSLIPIHPYTLALCEATYLQLWMEQVRLKPEEE